MTYSILLRTVSAVALTALILPAPAPTAFRAGRCQSTRSAQRLQGSEVAQRRRDARRPRHGVLRRAPAAAHLLLRRRRRRRLEDRGRRHHLGADQRRADHPTGSIGSIDVAPSNPESRLGRHRQRRDPLERDHRPRRLQVDRRRQELGVHGPQGVRTDRRHQGPSRPTPTSSGSRRSDRRSVRTTSAASSRPPTAARRGRRRCSSTTRPAAATSKSTGRIPTSSTRRCIAASARAGTSSAAARRARAASTSRSTAARRGRRSPPACRRS